LPAQSSFASHLRTLFWQSALQDLLVTIPVTLGSFIFWAKRKCCSASGHFLLLAITALAGPHEAIAYSGSREYTESLFVFTILVTAASRPILNAVTRLVLYAARVLPVGTELLIIQFSLTVIPLLGSFVTGKPA
jgi:hypothetical protein